MVADKGIAEEIDVEEAEHGKEHDQEISRGEEHRFDAPVAVPPQEEQPGGRCQRRQIRRRSRRIYSPARVDEDQGMWPKQLADRKSTRLNSSHLGISYAV